MKLKLKLLAAAFGLSLMSIAQSQAVMINGEIQFFGTATLDGNASSATSIAFNNPSIVTLATGSYAGLSGDDATFTDFTFGAPGTTGLVSVDPLWKVGDWEFELSSIFTNQDTGFARVLQGTGTASGPTGFDPSPGFWQLSTSGSGTSITFSSFSQVPDGGGTLALLGLALAGLPALRKKFTK